MPPKKKPTDELEGCVLNANFAKLREIEIKDDFVADLFNECGIIDRFTNAFATYAQLNEEAKEEIRKLEKKVPQTPKKATAHYRLILDEIEDMKKLNLNEDEVEASIMIPIAKLESPKKAVKVPDVDQTPRAVEKTPVHKPMLTPSRIDYLSKPKTPVSTTKFASSLASTKSVAVIVPKAANVKKPDPKEIAMKTKTDLQLAEERRIQQLKFKVEHIKGKREENQEKVRQRQVEEKAKLEMQKALSVQKEKKIKEFQAAQKDEANMAKTLALKVPTTPKNVEKKKEVATPRQNVVPLKKVKADDQSPCDSPKLKRKTAAREKKIIEEKERVRELREEEVFVLITPEELNPKSTKTGRHGKKAKRYSDFELSSFVQHERESADLLKATDETVTKDEEVIEVFREQTEGQILAESTEVLPIMNHLKGPRKIFSEIEFDSPLPQSKEIKHETMETDEKKDESDAEEPENKENHQECYEMTADKVFIPSTEDNYVVDDLSSNDDTDDEANPRKEVPKWAKKENLNPAVREMLKTTTLEERCAYFGRPRQPTLELLFPESKLKDTRHRNSSSRWHSPFSNPRPATSVRK